MSKHNQLINETSPYLLQHADNPVNWHAWRASALKLARDQDKPILLSIGYSACHWCHVMAHESFENEATATIMNELFINIKVDREERPDLDKIYQRAHQLMTQRPGGWPLTVFLMPDNHMPFFAGTYFPPEQRHGLPSFSDLMQRIADFYQHNRPDLEQQNASMRKSMLALQPASPSSPQPLDAAPLDMSRRQLENSMDWKHGGFGKAPKFPHPTNIERLLRHWALTGNDKNALKMACINLTKMANGGLNDQLGGGFCRYSVDDFWMIPHFEKMLYDNGPLLTLYSEAWSATHDPLLHQVMQTTSAWVMREMQSPQGGYFSSLDADSEGVEGKFYSWTREQIKSLLQDDEYQAFSMRYGIDRQPNFEGSHYYPHVFMSWPELEHATEQTTESLQTLVNSARLKLFNKREQRIHPDRDDKILTSWNALMIKGMAAAGRRLHDPALIDSAFRALDFIRSTLWVDNRLQATCKDGKAHLNAYLDDYAFLIDAIIELLQSRWRDGDLDFAIQLADVLLEQFEDQQHGGFFFTSNDHEQLIERTKAFGDDAIPSGNGIAAWALQRLAHIVGDMRYSDAAERTLQAASESIRQIPYAHNALLLALEETLHPVQIIILRGQGDQLNAWHQACHDSYAPRRICLAIADDSQALPGLLKSRESDNGNMIAYVCDGNACRAPIKDLHELQETIQTNTVNVVNNWQ